MATLGECAVLPFPEKFIFEIAHIFYGNLSKKAVLFFHGNFYTQNMNYYVT